tara:strand:- start:3433 stop:4506 length:1074 start_codon:yes stop_codon:yes gene_type:complete
MDIIPENIQKRIKKINEFDGQISFGAKNFNNITNRTGKGKPSSGYMTPEQQKIIKDTQKKRFTKIKEEDWISLKVCPICDEANSEEFVERLGLRYVRCSKCSHVYQNPVIKKEKAAELYSADTTSHSIYSVDLQKATDRKKYNYGLDLIEFFKPRHSKSKILDIGCGAGVFSEEALKRGYYKSVGADANESFLSSYPKSQKGLIFITNYFEKLSAEELGDNYDAISMWSCLEHIYDPKIFLAQLKRLLNKEGLLFILVPNVKSLATRLMREKSPCFTWKHPHYFNIDSLDLLMNQVGFINIHRETVISEIDNVKSYMSGEHPYHGFGDPENLFDFITPEYIHENMLGSRLISIYKKI